MRVGLIVVTGGGEGRYASPLMLSLHEQNWWDWTCHVIDIGRDRDTDWSTMIKSNNRNRYCDILAHKFRIHRSAPGETTTMMIANAACGLPVLGIVGFVSPFDKLDLRALRTMVNIFQSLGSVGSAQLFLKHESGLVPRAFYRRSAIDWRGYAKSDEPAGLADLLKHHPTEGKWVPAPENKQSRSAFGWIADPTNLSLNLSERVGLSIG